MLPNPSHALCHWLARSMGPVKQTNWQRHGPARIRTCIVNILHGNYHCCQGSQWLACYAPRGSRDFTRCHSWIARGEGAGPNKRAVCSGHHAAALHQSSRLNTCTIASRPSPRWSSRRSSRLFRDVASNVEQGLLESSIQTLCSKDDASCRLTEMKMGEGRMSEVVVMEVWNIRIHTYVFTVGYIETMRWSFSFWPIVCVMASVALGLSLSGSALILLQGGEKVQLILCTYLWCMQNILQLRWKQQRLYVPPLRSCSC